MTEPTAATLATVREALVEAKAVPMSASCMVNRSEMLALIDSALETLDADLAAARDLQAGAEQVMADATVEAASIVRLAQQDADELVAEHVIVARAQAEADALVQNARAEATELAREADAYVDGRIAAFEAAMARTLSDIKVMRERLSDRSHLDESNATALPFMMRTDDE